MCRYVDPPLTDVSEEIIASIIDTLSIASALHPSSMVAILITKTSI
jgi:hypothetical protein